MPSSESVVQTLKKLPLSVESESNIYGDATYTDYTIEEVANQGDDINLFISENSI